MIISTKDALEFIANSVPYQKLALLTGRLEKVLFELS